MPKLLSWAILSINWKIAGEATTREQYVTIYARERKKDVANALHLIFNALQRECAYREEQGQTTEAALHYVNTIWQTLVDKFPEDALRKEGFLNLCLKEADTIENSFLKSSIKNLLAVELLKMKAAV